MAFTLQKLPYDNNALEPYISAETINYHYGKHHLAYVNNLNKLIEGTEFLGLSLEAIIQKATGPIFNNAAQVWNHTFYWQGLTPGGSILQGPLKKAIDDQFGSFDTFKAQFTAASLALFGSGWNWLVQNTDNSLQIVQTFNAGTPLTQHQTPLLTCDVWEHAYYIDARNARAQYLDNFWQVVNWRFVADNFKA